MATISVRMNEEDMKTLKEYIQIHNLNLSDFIRNTVLDKIEDDLKMNEDKILKAWEESREEEGIPLEKMMKRLGL